MAGRAGRRRSDAIGCLEFGHVGEAFGLIPDGRHDDGPLIVFEHARLIVDRDLDLGVDGLKVEHRLGDQLGLRLSQKGVHEKSNSIEFVRNIRVALIEVKRFVPGLTSYQTGVRVPVC